MNEVIWNEGWHLWDLIRFLQGVGGLNSGCIYRGQSDSSWKLVPNLYRTDVKFSSSDNKSKAELYILAEQDVIDSFFELGALLIPTFRRNPIVDRVIAQHYGVPTQLLDWTVDPLLALYFAVSDLNRTTDAAFYYCYPLRGMQVKTPISFPFHQPLTKLAPPIIDSRIRDQKSVFTFQSFGSGDHFTPLEDRMLKVSPQGAATDPKDEVESFGKVIIPEARRSQILSQLLELGIDASLIYPGLQGIGERIATHARITGYSRDGRL